MGIFSTEWNAICKVESRVTGMFQKLENISV